MAYQIRDIFVSAGYPLLFDSPTNQQYPIMPDDELAELGKSFGYEYWERVDETHSGVRFCASWATTQEHCGRRYRLCGNKNRGSLLRKDMIYSCCLCPVDRINRGNISEIGTF